MKNISNREIWKKHPDIEKIEVSTLGNVRTLDKMVWNGRGIWLMKGRILKQQLNHNGYLQVTFNVNRKKVSKRVHRLVAQTFIPNPDGSPQVNHLDCDRRNNNVSNLEWCNNSYNQIYREKFGISATESRGVPIFAINLDTQEVSRFRSQNEASRTLGINQGNINSVIKGKRKQAGNYWFVNDDGHKDAQSVKDYSNQAVKSVSAK